MPAPAPAPANAYAAPFRESGEPGGAAREVKHLVLSCACTADCPHGAPLPTSCWRPCSLLCSPRPHPGQAESAFPGSDRDSVCIAVKTCFPCNQPGTARRLGRPGIWGRRGWETWGGSREEVMTAADFIF